jgi:HAD domain in Swiss Army Knife RNA repair proteins
MVDVDGVVSLFGSPTAASASAPHASSGAPDAPPPAAGSFHSIDGIPHFLSATAAAHLLDLSAAFELVWASGWEEKANEHLPHLLGLPATMPFIRFARPRQGGRTTHAHWKLGSIDAYAGVRPLAWIDDAFNPACHDWARAREAPTLLVTTAPEYGLTSQEAQLLLAWAGELERS